MIPLTNARQDQELSELIFKNLTIDAKIAVEWVAGEFSPEDLFDEDILGEWAEAHGYVKENE